MPKKKQIKEKVFSKEKTYFLMKNLSFLILVEKFDRVVKTATYLALEDFRKHCLKLCTCFQPYLGFEEKEGLESTSFLQGCHNCNPRAQRNNLRKDFLFPNVLFFVINFRV